VDKTDLDTAHDADLRSTAQRIGHQFADIELLRNALTHASVPRATGPCESERLEFLGDAVLAAAITEELFARHPEWDEGKLSRARAACVRTETLARKADACGLGCAIRLGKGEERTGGRTKTSVLAATYEAVLGAVMVDSGYGATRAIVQRHFAGELEADTPSDVDFKTQLQELMQARFRTAPVYRVVESSGPDHAPHFTVAVEIDGRTLAHGAGASKRAAEQDAAFHALGGGSLPGSANPPK
jgi:ribonuclease-3